MLSTEDRLDILDLHGYYAHCIDSGLGVEWSACFTPDGYLALPHRGQVTRGADALRAVAEKFPLRTGRRGRHVTTNITFREEEEGEVIARSYLTLFRGGWDEDPPVVELTGRYEDRLVRYEGCWVFACRVLTADG